MDWERTPTSKCVSIPNSNLVTNWKWNRPQWNCLWMWQADSTYCQYQTTTKPKWISNSKCFSVHWWKSTSKMKPKLQLHIWQTSLIPLPRSLDKILKYKLIFPLQLNVKFHALSCIFSCYSGFNNIPTTIIKQHTDNLLNECICIYRLIFSPAFGNVNKSHTFCTMDMDIYCPQ